MEWFIYSWHHSGQLLLCVLPAAESDALHSVKWHPKEPDTLAVASENKIFVIDLANTHALRGQPLPQSDLHHIGQLFSVPSVSLQFLPPPASFALTILPASCCLRL